MGWSYRDQLQQLSILRFVFFKFGLDSVYRILYKYAKDKRGEREMYIHIFWDLLYNRLLNADIGILF